MDVSTGERARAVRLTSQAAELIVAGRYPAALFKAEMAIAAAPNEAWAWYHKARALVGMGRIDEAGDAYRIAELRFPENDKFGRASALWGRATALLDAGRCEEAQPAVSEYIAYVESDATQADRVAALRARGCRVRPVASPSAFDERQPVSGGAAPERAPSVGSQGKDSAEPTPPTLPGTRR